MKSYLPVPLGSKSRGIASGSGGKSVPATDRAAVKSHAPAHTHTGRDRLDEILFIANTSLIPRARGTRVYEMNFNLTINYLSIPGQGIVGLPCRPARTSGSQFSIVLLRFSAARVCSVRRRSMFRRCGTRNTNQRSRGGVKGMSIMTGVTSPFAGGVAE